jgi:DNA-binding CsgD family transcriptional regulator
MSRQAPTSYVILRRGGWPSPEALRTSAKRSLAEAERVGDVSWVRSYVLAEPDGRVGTVCIYRAGSPDAIRDHALRAEIPVDEIIEIAELVVLLPDDFVELTNREHEVLDLVADGLQNREIANRLVVSVRTVDHHVSSAMRKLRTRSRGAAVAEARRRGLLTSR